MSFELFGLHPELLRGVKELGFQQPTTIQADAIPAGMEGRDVMACSATGSGKTAAFLLPILHRLLTQPATTKGTRVLVLTPTRELAAQIEQHLGELAKHTKIRGAAVYGGTAMGPQRRALERGVEIIIATPGRLLDHLRNAYARLGGVDTLVLDEADRMLDMGFMPDIRRILQHLTARRQTFFFSATMPSEIASLARELLQRPVAINLERHSKPAAGITQRLYPVPHALKPSLLLKVLQSEPIRNALVFTRTKRRADRVAEFLKRNGVTSTRIHGDRTQSQREQALEGFKRGRYKVLVATDVAARGIDIDALSHVINFDLPGSAEDYIHRIGRTARAQATGDAFTFVAPEDEGDLRIIEKVVGARLPRVTVQDFDYAAPVPVYGKGERSERQGHGGQRHRQGQGRGPRQERNSRAPRDGNRRDSFAREGNQRDGNQQEQQPQFSRQPGRPTSQSRRPWERSDWKPRRAGRGSFARPALSSGE